MGSLVEAVKDPVKRPAVISDCVRMLDAEVSGKRGLSGVAVKAGFKAIKKFKPDIVPSALEDLIDDFAAKVDPFWLECQSNGQSAGSFFVAKKTAIANALLEITDDRAQKSRHRSLVKAYKGLRGKAVDHIGAAMPRFSEIVVRHAS
jgi:hypothetical protein